ncbi:restriction endonuclease subunit S [Faecalibacterium prausnitzii]|uniref:restriction endonuclease subunit S n=1 Tax=Faecalibacterium prausnitzii TaxID=853 RepID=UPI0012DC743F|nr:restriction endonuclease subunit S [Faecalibacterium prausnitzii]
MARKMKDSGIEWIGEIPEGWEVSQLKYVTRWKSEKGCPDAPVLSLYRDFGVVPKDSRDDNHNVTSLDTSNYKVVDIGDLVINKMKAWQGSMAVSDYRGIVSPAYHVCSITSNKVNKRYLHHLLRNPAYLPEYARLSTGMRIGQWDLGFDDFKNIPFLIPPLDEQAKIADYLDNGCASLDAMLSKTRSSIEEYKKLKQAVITQAVTKGVRGEREMKDSKIDYIGQIPDEWVLCKLRNIGDAQNGISKSSDFFGKGTPFVSYSDVYKNYSLPFSVSGLVESTPAEQERYSVKEGDIFFTRTSETIEEVGYSCVCEKDIPHATFAGFLIRVRPFSDKLYTPYAKYYFRSSHLRFYLVKEMNLVTRASLGQSLLKSMPVLLPPLEEQKEVVDYLDAKCAEIDGLIAKKEQLVKELESYKKSLIYEVVTGKREV